MFDTLPFDVETMSLLEFISIQLKLLIKIRFCCDVRLIEINIAPKRQQNWSKRNGSDEGEEERAKAKKQSQISIHVIE